MSVFVVSDLYGKKTPVESVEPPVEPQKIKKVNMVQTHTDARMHKKLFDKMKDTLTHLMYLGK